MDTNKNRIFWGAFIVYNAHGKLIEKGEIYPPMENFLKMQLCVSQRDMTKII